MCVYIRNHTHRYIDAFSFPKEAAGCSGVSQRQGSWPGRLSSCPGNSLTKRIHWGAFEHNASSAKNALPLLVLTPSSPGSLLPPPLRIFLGFPPPTWVRSLFYVFAQRSVLTLCCSLSQCLLVWFLHILAPSPVPATQ